MRSLAPLVAGHDLRTSGGLMDGQVDTVGCALGGDVGAGHLHDQDRLAALRDGRRVSGSDVRAFATSAQPATGPTQELRIAEDDSGGGARRMVAPDDQVGRQPSAADVRLTRGQVVW